MTAMFAWSEGLAPTGVSSFTMSVGVRIDIPDGYTKEAAMALGEAAVRVEVARRGLYCPAVLPVLMRPIPEETTRAEFEKIFGPASADVKFSDERPVPFWERFRGR